MDSTVREARDAYLAENGFTVDEYDAKWTKASFFGIRFAVLNTRRHRVGIMLHDLHHVATGFGTDLAGEGEISMWEARGGLAALGPYVGGIVASGSLLGLLVAPRRAIRAFRAARGASLFPLCRLPKNEFDARYEELLAMSVAELRRMLEVPASGVADRPRKLHAYAPRPAADRQVHQAHAAH
ncbi:MAG TPA: hypothetical protein VGH28_32495 [Polyangiaceae bacterium]|jgi:hypothetical protein